MRYLLKTFSSAALILLISATHVLCAQDSQRFQEVVDSIVSLNHSVDRSNLVLFTGSSSIRMWSDLKASFPKHNVVNLGFGGSEMTDLLYFIDQLIVPFMPSQIFIYEGDNDIKFGRSAEQILLAADSIVSRVRQKNPKVEIVFISPKPSLARWKLKPQYLAFNKALKSWTVQKKNVRYADVWTPMVDSNGMVLQDIFIEDGLHLNKKGYKIWTKALQNYLLKN